MVAIRKAAQLTHDERCMIVGALQGLEPGDPIRDSVLAEMADVLGVREETVRLVAAEELRDTAAVCIQVADALERETGDYSG